MTDRAAHAENARLHAEAAEPGRGEGGVTNSLLPSAIGHVLPPALAGPIESLLRNIIYYRAELAGSWIDAAGLLAEEILAIEPGMPTWTRVSGEAPEGERRAGGQHQHRPAILGAVLAFGAALRILERLAEDGSMSANLGEHQCQR